MPLTLRTLGYDQPDIESILAYIEKEDTIEVTGDLKEEYLPVFESAFQPRNDAIRFAIEELLTAWSGWPMLKRTIDELPDLHVYRAGGVLRDILLGNNRPAKDFDFILGGSAIAKGLDRLTLAGRKYEQNVWLGFRHGRTAHPTQHDEN